MLYPIVFPHLAAYKKKRADLVAILLTGLPAGVVPGFQNYTGPRAVGHAPAQRRRPARVLPNDLGLIAGDPAGYPNGRRLSDDVVTIEVRAIAGLTIPLVDKSYLPDAPALVVADGTINTNNPLLPVFPYLGLPGGGYQTVPGIAPATGLPTVQVPLPPTVTVPSTPPLDVPGLGTLPDL